MKMMKPGFLSIYLLSLPLVSEYEIPAEVFEIIGHLYVFPTFYIDFLEFGSLPQD